MKPSPQRLKGHSMSNAAFIVFCAVYESDHAPVVAVINDPTTGVVRQVDTDGIVIGNAIHNRAVFPITMPDDAPYGAYAAVSVPSDAFGHPIWPGAFAPHADKVGIVGCPHCFDASCWGDCQY